MSISEVNGAFDNGFENIHLYTAQEEIAKYLLYTKNQIIYGGDILDGYPSELYVRPALVEVENHWPIVQEETFPRVES